MSDAGIRRSAVLLFSLGQADAVEVFKYLGPKEVQKISTMMTQITNLGRDEIMQAAQLFRDEAQMRASIDASDEFLKRVLTEALGSAEAAWFALAAALAVIMLVFQMFTLVFARELTKLFETIHSCPSGEALAWLRADANRQRGEFVLLVSGAVDAGGSGEGERVLKLLLDDGISVKQAARLAHAITGAPKNAMYELALSLKE